MKLLLLNPFNPVVSLSKIQRWNRLNKYRVWKPLGLLILARLTPPDWEVEVIDENLGPVDAQVLPRADLVGITAFTSQATRAYEPAALFRAGAGVDGGDPSGAPRPAGGALPLRFDPGHPGLPFELLVLQRDGLQRRPVPPPADRERNC